MSIDTTNSILTKQEFDKRLSDLLGQLEGRKPNPYIDKTLVPTIGIGINLRVEKNRISVFDAMGIPQNLRGALITVMNDTSIKTTAALQQRLDRAKGVRDEFFLTTKPMLRCS